MDMNQKAKLWKALTAEALSWQLGQHGDTLPHNDEDAHTAQEKALRLVRHCQRTHPQWLLLLGGGQGHLLEALGRMDPELPPDMHVLTLETDMHRARILNARFAATPLPPRFHWLADTSPWALLLLTRGLGLDPSHCALSWTVARSHMCPAANEGSQALESWRRLFCGAQRVPLPTGQGKPQAAHLPRISLGAIVHPQEPHLAQFFAHLPHWLHEVVVIWDSHAPKTTPPCPVPLRTLSRPLAGDFAAQRNAMLDMCTGQVCLYLDADERLAPEHWEVLAHLASQPHVSALLPRITFEGDTDHARVGYGLWPDVQLRLFPLDPRPHFVGAVHERLEACPAQPLLLPGVPILHYSHVFKDGQALRQRLQTFDQAAGCDMHALSHAYPRLPLPLLRHLGQHHAEQWALRLPL